MTQEEDEVNKLTTKADHLKYRKGSEVTSIG